MTELEYLKKQAKFEIEFLQKWQDKDKLSEKERMILVLEYVDIHIHPNSINGRLGIKKELKKIKKIIKEQTNER